MKRIIASILVYLTLLYAADLWAAGPGAALFGGSADAQLTTSLPNEDNVSATFWYMRIGNGADSSEDDMLSLSDTVPALIWAVARNDGTGKFAVATNNLIKDGATSTTDNTWWFLAFRRTGNQYDLYLNGSATSDITGTITAETAAAAAHFTVGGERGNAGVTHRCNCRIAALKFWNAYLDPNILANEKYSYRPRYTTSLYGFWPFNNSLTVDFGGSAHALTNTSGTSDDGPYISW